MHELQAMACIHQIRIVDFHGHHPHIYGHRVVDSLEFHPVQLQPQVQLDRLDLAVMTHFVRQTEAD